MIALFTWGIVNWSIGQINRFDNNQKLQRKKFIIKGQSNKNIENYPMSNSVIDLIMDISPDYDSYTE